jgi:hypothetical protein
MLVCVPDPDPLFPVLIAVEVVIEPEVDTTVEPEVDTAAGLEDDTAAELDGLADTTTELGIASPAAANTKPQAGVVGPGGALAQTSITH